MNVLIVNGNPETESFSKSICLAYQEGASGVGHRVKVLNIAEIKFNPVLQEGYHVIQDPEPDLIQFQEDVLWANHIVIVYPTWWGGMPAALKGLFDRAFLPGFAFKYHTKDPFWDKLLKGRSGHIITTMDAPYLWDWLINRSSGINMLKKAILNFCGISPVKTTVFDRFRHRDQKQISSMIKKIKVMASGL
jgi:NAD(P)H dehydrogenase (quinone)